MIEVRKGNKNTKHTQPTHKIHCIFSIETFKKCQQKMKRNMAITKKKINETRKNGNN